MILSERTRFRLNSQSYKHYPLQMNLNMNLPPSTPNNPTVRPFSELPTASQNLTQGKADSLHVFGLRVLTTPAPLAKHAGPQDLPALFFRLLLASAIRLLQFGLEGLRVASLCVLGQHVHPGRRVAGGQAQSLDLGGAWYPPAR